MTPLKIFAAGLGAALLASSMLAGTSFAAPKPQMNLNIKANVPKPMIIKPMRPNIVRRPVQIHVDKDRLQKSKGENGDQSEQAPASDILPRKSIKTAAILPPKRIPQPRPDFNDALKDIRDAIGASDIAGADADAFQVSRTPHGTDGPLGDFGLPGQDAEDAGKTPGNGQASDPLANVPGSQDSLWKDPNGAVGAEIPNPAGDNSHSKNGPAVPGFLSAKTPSLADIDPAADKPSRPETPVVEEPSEEPQGAHHTESREIWDDGTVEVLRTYYFRDGSGWVTMDTHHPDGSRDRVSWDFDSNGEAGPSRIRTWGPDELRNPDYAGGDGYVPPNCGSVECNEARKGNPGLRLRDGVIRALTDPEHSATTARAGKPIVSQHHLLSQYDPDFVAGNEPARINKPRIQSD